MGIRVNFEANTASIRQGVANLGRMLSQTSRQADATNRQINKMGRAKLSSTSREVRKLNDNFTEVSKSAAGVLKTMKLIAGVSFAGLAVYSVQSKISGYGDELTNIENKIKVVLKASDDMMTLRNRLYEISTTTQTSIDGAVETFNRMALSMGEDYPTEKIIKTVEAIQYAAKISGGSAEAVNAAVLQLGQGISGDFEAAAQELNSLKEQAPRIAIAIADGLGVGVKDLKKMAEEGDLTGKKVTEALMSQLPKLQEEFSRLKKTSASSFSTMRDNFALFMGEVDKELGFSQKKSKFYQSMSRFFLEASLVIGDDIQLLRKKIADKFNKITTFFSNVWDKIPQGPIDAMKRMVQGISNTVHGLWSRVSGAFMEFVDRVKTLFWDLYIWLVGNSVWPDTIDEIVDYAKNLWARAKTGFLVFARGVKVLFWEVYSDIGTFIEGLKERFITFVATSRYLSALFESEAFKAGFGFVNAVLDSVMSFDLKGVVLNIASILAVGLTATVDWLTMIASRIMKIFDISISQAVFFLTTGLVSVFSLTFRALAVSAIKKAFLFSVIVPLLDTEPMRDYIMAFTKGFVETIIGFFTNEVVSTDTAPIRKVLSRMLLPVEEDDQMIAVLGKKLSNLFNSVGTIAIASMAANIKDKLPEHMKAIIAPGTNSFVENAAEKYGSTLGNALLVGVVLAISPAMRNLSKSIWGFLFSKTEVTEQYKNFAKNAKNILGLGAGFIIANEITRSLGLDQAAIGTTMFEVGITATFAMAHHFLTGALAAAKSANLLRLVRFSMVGIVLGWLFGSEMGKALLEGLPVGLRKAVDQAVGFIQDAFTDFFEYLIETAGVDSTGGELIRSAVELAKQYSAIFTPIGITVGLMMGHTAITMLMRGVAWGWAKIFASPPAVVATAGEAVAKGSRFAFLGFVSKMIPLILAGLVGYDLIQNLASSGGLSDLETAGVAVGVGIMAILIQSILVGAATALSAKYAAAGGAKAIAGRIGARVAARIGVWMMAGAVFNPGMFAAALVLSLGTVITIALHRLVVQKATFEEMIKDFIPGLGADIGQAIGAAFAFAVGMGLIGGLGKTLVRYIFLASKFAILAIGWKNMLFALSYILTDQISRSATGDSLSTQLARSITEALGATMDDLGYRIFGSVINGLLAGAVVAKKAGGAAAFLTAISLMVGDGLDGVGIMEPLTKGVLGGDEGGKLLRDGLITAAFLFHREIGWFLGRVKHSVVAAAHGIRNVAHRMRIGETLGYALAQEITAKMPGKLKSRLKGLGFGVLIIQAILSAATGAGIIEQTFGDGIMSRVGDVLLAAAGGAAAGAAVGGPWGAVAGAIIGAIYQAMISFDMMPKAEEWMTKYKDALKDAASRDGVQWIEVVDAMGTGIRDTLKASNDLLKLTWNMLMPFSALEFSTEGNYWLEVGEGIKKILVDAMTWTKDTWIKILSSELLTAEYWIEKGKSWGESLAQGIKSVFTIAFWKGIFKAADPSENLPSDTYLPPSFRGVYSAPAPLKKADGGYITGPGTTTSDSIPAMLSNKEFVVNAASTKKFRPVLEAINSGRYGKFASGTSSSSYTGTGPHPPSPDESFKTPEVIMDAWNSLWNGATSVKDALTGAGDSAEKTAKAVKGATKASKASLAAAKALAEQKEKDKNFAERMAKAYKNDHREIGADGADAIRESFKTSLSSWVKGDMSFGDMLHNILDQITSQIIDTFINSFVDKIFSPEGLNLGNIFGGILKGQSEMGEAVGTKVSSTIQKGVSNAADSDLAPGLGGIFKNLFSGLTGEGGLLSGLLGSGGGGGLFSSIFGMTFGSFLGLANGGYVRGPGSTTSDSIPAMLSDQEFVVNAAATKRHLPLLSAINSGQSLASFAKGGQVGYERSATNRNAAPTPQQVSHFSIQVTGDVSRQTRREITRTITDIAAGVNKVNKENGVR